VGLVLLVSPRERSLALGAPVSHGLLPDTPTEWVQAENSVFRGRINTRE